MPKSYQNLHITPPGTSKPPDPYQQFYLTTPNEVKKLAERLKNDPEQVAACRKRLEELENLLRLGDNRCFASRVQRDFLQKILEPYKNA